MTKPRRTLPTLTTALAASTCLLAAACTGPAAGRPNGERAGGAGPPPVAQAGERKESPRLYRVLSNGKVGFIDNTGRLVIPPKFEGGYVAREFSDGMAMTAAETSARPGFTCCQYGFINAEGRVVVEPRYPEARDFSEGLAAVAMGDRWGYIDREGRSGRSGSPPRASPRGWPPSSKTAPGGATSTARARRC
jgi:hypothetical protein